MGWANELASYLVFQLKCRGWDYEISRGAKIVYIQNFQWLMKNKVEFILHIWWSSKICEDNFSKGQIYVTSQTSLFCLEFSWVKFPISMDHMYVFVLSRITKAKKGKVRNLEIVSIFKKVF